MHLCVNCHWCSSFTWDICLSLHIHSSCTINLLHHCWVAYQLHTVLPFVPHYSSTKTYRVKTFILQIKLEPTNINMSFKRFLKVLLHAYSHEFSSRVNWCQPIHLKEFFETHAYPIEEDIIVKLNGETLDPNPHCCLLCYFHIHKKERPPSLDNEVMVRHHPRIFKKCKIVVFLIAKDHLIKSFM